MRKKEKTEEETPKTPVTEETPKTPVTEETPKTNSDIAVVTWRGNTREYSLEVHGKKFRELAKQFAKKIKGGVK